MKLSCPMFPHVSYTVIDDLKLIIFLSQWLLYARYEFSPISHLTSLELLPSFSTIS